MWSLFSLSLQIVSSSPAAPFRYWKATKRIPYVLLSSRLHSPTSPRLFKRGVPGLWSPVWPPLASLQLLHVLLMLEAPEVATVLQMGLQPPSSCWAHFFWWNPEYEPSVLAGCLILWPLKGGSRMLPSTETPKYGDPHACFRFSRGAFLQGRTVSVHHYSHLWYLMR